MQSGVQTPGTLRFHSCVSQHLLGIRLHVSLLPFVPWSIPDAWNHTTSANCGSIELILHGCVYVPSFFFCQCCLAHAREQRSPKILMFWICDTLRLAHDQLPTLLSITQNSNAHQMLISLCPKVQCDSPGWLHYACQSQSELVPVDWALA